MFLTVIIDINCMSTRIEYPKRYGWWINELNSLGVAAKKMNELNDLKEISKLASNIKHALIQDYNNCKYPVVPNTIITRPTD
jgi:hypothetical protein